jgi:ABC-2 type transport system ATP-binding protein
VIAPKDTVKTLSGGLQRRVEVAKGMIHSPQACCSSTSRAPVSIRPRAASCVRTSSSARDEEGVTIVMTTHILEEAEHCDAVTILDHGKAIASGSPESLQARDLRATC